MKTSSNQNTIYDSIITQVDDTGKRIQSLILTIDPTLDRKVVGGIAWGSVAALYFNTAVKLVGNEMLSDEYVWQQVRTRLPEKKIILQEYDMSDFKEHSSWYDEFTVNVETGKIYQDRDISEIPMKFSVQLFGAVYEPDEIDAELNHCFKSRYCNDEIRQCFNEFLVSLQSQYQRPDNKADIDLYISVLNSTE